MLLPEGSSNTVIAMDADIVDKIHSNMRGVIDNKSKPSSLASDKRTMVSDRIMKQGNAPDGSLQRCMYALYAYDHSDINNKDSYISLPPSAGDKRGSPVSLCGDADMRDICRVELTSAITELKKDLAIAKEEMVKGPDALYTVNMNKTFVLKKSVKSQVKTLDSIKKEIKSLEMEETSIKQRMTRLEDEQLRRDVAAEACESLDRLEQVQVLLDVARGKERDMAMQKAIGEEWRSEANAAQMALLLEIAQELTAVKREEQEITWRREKKEAIKGLLKAGIYIPDWALLKTQPEIPSVVLPVAANTSSPTWDLIDDIFGSGIVTQAAATHATDANRRLSSANTYDHRDTDLFLGLDSGGSQPTPASPQSPSKPNQYASSDYSSVESNSVSPISHQGSGAQHVDPTPQSSALQDAIPISCMFDGPPITTRTPDAKMNINGVQLLSIYIGRLKGDELGTPSGILIRFCGGRNAKTGEKSMTISPSLTSLEWWLEEEDIFSDTRISTISAVCHMNSGVTEPFALRLQGNCLDGELVEELRNLGSSPQGKLASEESAVIVWPVSRTQWEGSYTLVLVAGFDVGAPGEQRQIIKF
eukprot:Tbor_TRINITY_DN5977_c4_g1::TRINITY_DN5977_c4_g1_i2::g.19366::m.19366